MVSDYDSNGSCFLMEITPSNEGMKIFVITEYLNNSCLAWVIPKGRRLHKLWIWSHLIKIKLVTNTCTSLPIKYYAHLPIIFSFLLELISLSEVTIKSSVPPK